MRKGIAARLARRAGSAASISGRFYDANPPKEVTDPMFTPTTRKVNNEQGYGMQLYWFVWEQYAKGFPPTDLELCHDAP
jgi:hypothetical protein